MHGEFFPRCHSSQSFAHIKSGEAVCGDHGVELGEPVLAEGRVPAECGVN